MYDLMSSRLTNMHTHNLMDGSLFGYNKKCSFGVLDFDTTAQDPFVSYTIKNIDNEISTIPIRLNEISSELS